MNESVRALLEPQPLQADLLNTPLYREAGVEVHLLRLDQIGGGISGNKWYKLQHNLLQAASDGADVVVSFGGAWSNHIHALACAGARFGIRTHGIIRGEASSLANPMLMDAARWGMTFDFVSRAEYRQRHCPQWLAALQQRIPGGYIVPEGGSNLLALKGVAGLVEQIETLGLEPDYLVAPCGTGGTLAGLIARAPSHWRILGIAALKGAGFLYQDIRQLLAQADATESAPWCIDLDGHCRGYGKTTPELLAFMREFESTQGVLLDHVYTAKMLFRLEKLIENSAFTPGSRILALHTGGVQGRRGLFSG